ncbi:transcriptional regulator [Lichenibacterium minor]|uniref:Transcriptional regulator n=1 Tax=Lichenibacterium minor TaxID=2316528 RepID=A0A4Q2TZL4_9HYPH|nr:transcriptional regulator [Lichenibacterium minor]RYC29210.1 transcriptional regulator [Lichenibacterium minor]
MLTGRQIREARYLLGWGRVRFSQKTSVTQAMVAAIESSDGPAWLTKEQESAIRQALEEGGVEFIPENGEGPGVRLRKVDPT